MGIHTDAVVHLLRAPLLSPSHESNLLYLCDVYGFVFAFETGCASSGDLASALGTRARSTGIANELVERGLDRAELAAIAARFPAPHWDRPIDALGWLFVVERLEMAHRALGTDLAHVQARIGSIFERHVVDESDVRRVTHAARQALQALEDWTLATAATSANLELAQVRFA